MATILNLSMEEKEALSDFYDKVKQRYEAALERGLRSLFKTIADDLLLNFSEENAVQDITQYQDELNYTLSKTYRQTSSYFSKHYEREMEKQQDDGDSSEFLFFLILLRKEQSRKIALANNVASRNVIPLHSASILRTTQKVITSEIEKSAIALAETNPNAADIVVDALPNIRERNRNRSGTIAETEVGTAQSIGTQSENTIFNDAIDNVKKNPELAGEQIGLQLDDDTLAALNNLFLDKTWISELDNVVRETHLAAHGQIQPSEEPFQVGGSLMRQPRDSSLGAPLSEIINCRCNSISS